MQDDSPDQQKKAIIAFAKQKGYQLVDWYTDFGISGTTFEKRAAFLKLKADVENGHRFGTVICYDESRWGRAIDSEENTYWRVHFRRCGVEVVLVKTSIDPENEFSPMISSLESLQASQFSKKLSELTLRGAMNNGIFSNGGTAPYGYARMARSMKTGNTRELEPGDWCVKRQEKVFWVKGREEEIETVQFIFEQRAQGLAYVLIAKSLNDRGVSCAKRGKWRNLDQKWSTGTIKSIVENPVYYGARVYNRYSSSKIIAQKKKIDRRRSTDYPAWRNPPDQWCVELNAHPAIVSKELWDKANAANRRQPQSKPNGHTYHSQYLLTGLIRCAKCGFAFQGWTCKVRGKTYRRYIDGGWKSKRVCKSFGVPVDQMEDFAIQSVKETLSDPALVRQIEERLRDLMEAGANGAEGEVTRLQQEKDETDRKIENLLRLVEQGSIEGDSVRKRLNELEEEKQRSTSKLARAGSTRMTPQLEDLGRIVADFILNFERNFEKAPIEERKVLMQKCISRIEVDREARVARFYVRRVPAVVPVLEEAENRVEKAKRVMTHQSARRGT